MKEQTIKNIIQFMSRVQLTGAEVPAFNEIIKELQEELKPKEVSLQ